MHIGILETGRAREYLVARHGTFAEMFQNWLAGHRAELTFTSYQVHEGELPADVRACDAWLITGSPAGVYENLAWIPPLEAFIHAVAHARVPQIGICFGHQVLASAFGGTVVKSERGWGLGAHRSEIVEQMDWMEPPSESITLRVTHQDQVVEAPDDAVLLATSTFCPMSALAYPDRRAISFQGHPEHRPAFSRDLIELRRGQGVEESVLSRAEVSLSTPTDEDRIAEWVLRFVEGAR